MTGALSETERDALWTCQTCGRRWVVPSLARDCETRHEREEA